MQGFFGDLDDKFFEHPVNVLRAMLHPDGMAKRVRNYEQWRAGTLRRVRRQLERTAAEGLAELLEELESCPAPPGRTGSADTLPDNDLVTPTECSTSSSTLGP